MNQWGATRFDAKGNLLRVVRAEAEGLFALVGVDGCGGADRSSS